MDAAPHLAFGPQRWRIQAQTTSESARAGAAISDATSQLSDLQNGDSRHTLRPGPADCQSVQIGYRVQQRPDFWLGELLRRRPERVWCGLFAEQQLADGVGAVGHRVK